METPVSEHIRKATIPAFLLVLIVSIPLTVDAAGSDDNPNIVLVLMDNFGYGEPGVYGGGEIRGAPTPNIDSIAHEGFQLTNYTTKSMVRVEFVGVHAG
jgi:arylsulfatase